MADISEPAPVASIPHNDRRKREQPPKKHDEAPEEQAAEQPPDASDVTTIMGIPATEMTPKVQEVLSSLMAQFAKLRNELEAANSHNQYLEQLSERHPYLPVVNRRGLHRELTRMLAISERTAITNTLVCFHMRNIEDIRRQYGHGAAEAGLTWAAEKLTGEIRDADVLGGMGGHDFGVILALSAGEDASVRAVAMKEAVETGAFSWKGESLSLDVAYGLHTFEAGDTAETLMDRADEDLLARERGGV